jgi:hypothetical protein
MKKLIIAALLLVSACEKSPADKAHDYFVKFCEDDTKSKDYDCGCQADMVDDEFNDEEMISLVNYLIYMKTNDPKLAEIKDSKDTLDIFLRLAKLSPQIREKCKS